MVAFIWETGRNERVKDKRIFSYIVNMHESSVEYVGNYEENAHEIKAEHVAPQAKQHVLN